MTTGSPATGRRIGTRRHAVMRGAWAALAVLASVGSLAWGFSASAEEWPTKPVRVIYNYPPGTGGDAKAAASAQLAGALAHGEGLVSGGKAELAFGADHDAGRAMTVVRPNGNAGVELMTARQHGTR